MFTDAGSGKSRQRIILDANALFVPFQFKIDIFEELGTLLNGNFELILLSPIQRELETISKKGSPKLRRIASHALKLGERCKFFEMSGDFSGSPDDAIIEMARKWNCLVFTNDRELKRKLRNINVPVVYVRQKSRLEINGRI